MVSPLERHRSDARGFASITPRDADHRGIHSAPSHVFMLALFFFLLCGDVNVCAVLSVLHR